MEGPSPNQVRLQPRCKTNKRTEFKFLFLFALFAFLPEFDSWTRNYADCDLIFILFEDKWERPAQKRPDRVYHTFAFLSFVPFEESAL